MFGKTQIQPDVIDTSSKVSLKLSCLRATGNDVAKASELYNFICDGIDSMPDFEPIPPGGFEKAKQIGSELYSWIMSHREELTQGISIVQGIAAKLPKTTDVPPIPKL